MGRKNLIDLDREIDRGPEQAVTTYGNALVKAATQGIQWEIDPLLEAVTQEAAFLRDLVLVARAKDLTELGLVALAKMMDQISRSIDTIIRTVEFAAGRADSRPEVVLQQTMLELLNEQELEVVEGVYQQAEHRSQKQKRTDRGHGSTLLAPASESVETQDPPSLSYGDENLA